MLSSFCITQLSPVRIKWKSVSCARKIFPLEFRVQRFLPSRHASPKYFEHSRRCVLEIRYPVYFWRYSCFKSAELDARESLLYFTSSYVVYWQYNHGVHMLQHDQICTKNVDDVHSNNKIIGRLVA